MTELYRFVPTPAVAGRPVQLTPELIDYYVAKARRERSRILLGGLARALAALRRHVSGQPKRLSGQDAAANARA